jgi:hypothetical protein
MSRHSFDSIKPLLIVDNAEILLSSEEGKDIIRWIHDSAHKDLLVACFVTSKDIHVTRIDKLYS